MYHSGMVSLLELLDEESVAEPGLMKYLSTHPETEARIRNAKQKSEGTRLSLPHPRLDDLFCRIKDQLPV
jgi:predicted Zn-dependent protease